MHLRILLFLAQLDPGHDLNEELAKRTEGRVQLRFELKQRAENRTGILFGRDRDIAADFIRTRFGITVKPASWVKISALAQDTRAPWYGGPAPGNVRDPLDLQEGYIELFSKSQLGWGFNFGRQMINYGDARLIGSPQWAYTARTWDTARFYHVTKKVRLEALAISTIVPRGDGFNKPVLGDRIWGTYNTFRDVFRKAYFEAYVLRHDQNFPGGFTGPGRLGINLYGSRWIIPAPHHFRLTLEGVLQNGKVGLLKHRAGGGIVQLNYLTKVGKFPVDFANEYKYASGTDPRSGHDSTFDQLYPAAHDKFGHVDLIGWKNAHNIRSMTTMNVTKNWNWILMYNATWLANTRDALYGTNSRPIARSINGTAGRYVGQELDLYSNYTRSGWAISAGLGHFFPGTFVNNTTPGSSSQLFYLSTSYSF